MDNPIGEDAADRIKQLTDDQLSNLQYLHALWAFEDVGGIIELDRALRSLYNECIRHLSKKYDRSEQLVEVTGSDYNRYLPNEEGKRLEYVTSYECNGKPVFTSRTPAMFVFRGRLDFNEADKVDEVKAYALRSASVDDPDAYNFVLNRFDIDNEKSGLWDFMDGYLTYSSDNTIIGESFAPMENSRGLDVGIYIKQELFVEDAEEIVDAVSSICDRYNRSFHKVAKYLSLYSEIAPMLMSVICDILVKQVDIEHNIGWKHGKLYYAKPFVGDITFEPTLGFTHYIPCGDGKPTAPRHVMFKMISVKDDIENIAKGGITGWPKECVSIKTEDVPPDIRAFVAMLEVTLRSNGVTHERYKGVDKDSLMYIIRDNIGSIALHVTVHPEPLPHEEIPAGANII